MANILVVEDIPAVLFSLRMVLQVGGHQVTTAANGAQGLALLKEGRFDLVVTDIWMPGTDGAAVIAEGRRVAPDTRFLAITGGSPNGTVTADRLQGESFGADRILFKPFERDEILGAVNDLVAGASQRSSL
ncbi:MAG TPA: response regulator [Azospirillum sp.]